MVVELNNVSDYSADGHVIDVNQNLLDLLPTFCPFGMHWCVRVYFSFCKKIVNPKKSITFAARKIRVKINF